MKPTRLCKLALSAAALALVAGGFSSCTSTDTHYVRSDHYDHYVPREYSSEHTYYSSPSYTYGSPSYTEEPSDYRVVNQYDRQAR